MIVQYLTTWFAEYFKPTAKNYCPEKKIPFKILLFTDDTHGHPRVLMKMYNEIYIVFMSANAAAIFFWKSYFLFFIALGFHCHEWAFSSCARASHCNGFSSCGAQALCAQASSVKMHEFSCSEACGIFPDQGSNLCPLHWQSDSYPLYHQGSPPASILQHMD